MAKLLNPLLPCTPRLGLLPSSLYTSHQKLAAKGITIASLPKRRLNSLISHLQSTMAGNTSEEENALRAAAQNLAKQAEAGVPTIFDKIVKKEIPCTSVYEDEKVLAFRDINPQAPTHIVIIPKDRDGLTQLSKAEERHKEILGHLMYVATVVAKDLGLKDGFRIVINDGVNGCQSVYHLHIHLLGGRQMKWPPG
ncbi:histidine triad (HIT) family protein [Marchantia polymorpha subsp. ruderalis]|uniref:HIT domain-containing protein n=2 Tax=Marchantia polymorpha TaxID=3197 RepID=A0AAF6B4T1_MARPO|nr:hypothetical protein MARPO_0066s0117 [Marchantia polymorpha]BBN07015.1 hypothetical protein Mp_4g00240 [Marchantia polymorpha subsp. ruderalis]|eukprot:PTQ36169.1 hypothetical protein MARPO_0066s0117 [Marchantia polymorpha]